MAGNSQTLPGLSNLEQTSSSNSEIPEWQNNTSRVSNASSALAAVPNSALLANYRNSARNDSITVNTGSGYVSVSDFRQAENQQLQAQTQNNTRDPHFFATNIAATSLVVGYNSSSFSRRDTGLTVPSDNNDQSSSNNITNDTAVNSSRGQASVSQVASNTSNPTVQDTTKRIAYKAQIRLQFTPDSVNVIDMDPLRIAYILMDYLYDEVEMPKIYMSLVVSNELYNQIIECKSTGRFRLTILLASAYDSNMITKVIMDRLFTYIPSCDNPNYTEILDNGQDEYFSNAYKRIMIGLIDPELNNDIRKDYNGIFSNISTFNVLCTAFEGIKYPVVEVPTYDSVFENLIIPPLTSRTQLIDYIFSKKPFYDTKYRYFMDFDKTYLMSRRGLPVYLPESPSNIILDIKSLTETEAYIQGFEIKDSSYYISINPTETNVVFDESVDKVANRIVTVSDDGESVSEYDVAANVTIGNEIKPVYIRATNNTDATIYKNYMDEGVVGIQIVKQHLDPTIFTINKSVYINNYSDQYQQYNGNYIISFRKDFYKCVAGEFVISSIIGLKKVGAITPLGSNEPVEVVEEPDATNIYYEGAIPSATSAAQTSSRGQASKSQAADQIRAASTNIGKAVMNAAFTTTVNAMIASGATNAQIAEMYKRNGLRPPTKYTNPETSNNSASTNPRVSPNTGSGGMPSNIPDSHVSYSTNTSFRDSKGRLCSYSPSYPGASASNTYKDNSGRTVYIIKDTTRVGVYLAASIK